MGPYKTPNFDMKFYFLTIVDDCSRYTWIHLLQLKSENIMALKDFLLMIKTQFGTSVKIIRTDNGIKTQFGTSVKIIRTDNGTKFFNNQCNVLFKSLGILHQSNCTYTPQQMV